MCFRIFLIVRKPPGLEFGKDWFAINRYFEATSIRRDQNEAFDFAFEFRYEFVGQTDRLRFIASSLAIEYFDFHTLIFNHGIGKKKEFFISKKLHSRLPDARKFYLRQIPGLIYW